MRSLHYKLLIKITFHNNLMLKDKLFLTNPWILRSKKLFLQNKLKAYHNKDYSVVKTFKAGSNSRFLFYEAFMVVC
ncbi:hypothetical protein SAMN05444362_1307 [Dysgonomonas macrotermitis]|uniref:Uncharacterized protein n=1 Tax=Dysgonomonas macrotermitis TaxID=1346286 RepID=A0A1M5JWY1_9BACT|nr:hypothetical protein SAMN05444362_1307 [Dysgonomonas macrotermitis]